MESDTQFSIAPNNDSKTSISISDSLLIRQFRNGCQKSAAILHAKYADRLESLVRARLSPEVAGLLDPEDVVQSIFRRFFCGVSEGRYDLPQGEELWGLFLVIALNRIRSKETFHRVGKRDVRMTINADDIRSVFFPPASASETELSLLRWTIEEALQKLPTEYREVVELRIENYEVQEIADTTGRSKRTVERILQQFRRTLQAMIEREEVAL